MTHPIPELREPLCNHDPAEAQPRPRKHGINCEVDDQSEPCRPRAHHRLKKAIFRILDSAFSLTLTNSYQVLDAPRKDNQSCSH